MPQGSFPKSDIGNEAQHFNRSGDGNADFTAGRDGRDLKLAKATSHLCVGVKSSKLLICVNTSRFGAA